MSIATTLIGGHMLNFLFIVYLFAFIVHDVFGPDTDIVSVFLKEGDSVTLHNNVKSNQQDRIKWYFNDRRIAQITGAQSKICTDDQCKERFRDRLKLDHQTGSLTIMNITNTHSGEYTLKIFSSSNSEKIFNVSVHGVAAVRKGAIVKEGESVILETPEVKNTNDVMMWYYNDTLIAEITGDQSQICTDDQCEERFRNRLKLDHQTGSLTITNTTHTDSGEYKLQITSISSDFNITSIMSFSVTVSGLGSSSVVLTGTAVAVLLVFAVAAAVAAVGVLYYRCRISRNEQVNMSCDLKGPQDIMVNQPQSFPLTKPSKGK